jgi:hypothetical protein
VIDEDTRWYLPGAPLSAWQRGLTCVTTVGLRFEQSGSKTEGYPAQSFTVTNFKLVGEGFETDPGNLSRVALAMKKRFGVTTMAGLTEQQRKQDKDGDGMADIDELIAGTDADDESSLFAVEIVDKGNDAMTLRWKYAEGNTYTLLGTDALELGLEILEEGITADTAGVEIVDGYMVVQVSAAGKAFYRVKATAEE